MKPTNNRTKIRSVIKWILWVILIQFLLFNISGAFYGYKLTYFYEPDSKAPTTPSKNIFLKTWKLFTGPRFQKTVIEEIPHFPYDTVHLVTKENLRIEGWYMPADSSRGTVILVHGLGQNKSLLLSQAYEFRYLGFNVMLIDLRAHGNSSGNVTTMGFRESEEIKLAYQYISEKGEKNIIFYGISMGARVIAKAIYDYELAPSRIIFEIPFDNVEKLVGKRVRMLGFPEEPFGTMITFWAGVERGFNGFLHSTSEYVQKIKCPVLVQYGALDQIVSERETNSIFDRIACNDKRLVKYPTANHELLLNKNPDKWRKEVNEFLVK
jgi:alpha-beta hydrolase superfamily lysophospholipase